MKKKENPMNEVLLLQEMDTDPQAQGDLEPGSWFACSEESYFLCA